MRVWSVGDPEPEDHPDVTGTDESSLVWQYRWEAACEENGGYAGWWVVDMAGDLFDWDEILNETGVLTECVGPEEGA